ncbi:MAG: glycosyltransferase family 4 protein, partial [Ignavibacteriales bacterium]|nr:glycosyltransferase family 4 protein [Ignavibacteriales bacterium]
MNSHQKTILFMTPGFPIGGAETFLINLLNKCKNKIRAIVISLGAGDDALRKLDPDIHVIELKRKWKYDLSIIGRLTTIIKANKIDCAFVINYFPFFFLKYAIDRSGKPFNVFISVHSTKPRSLKEYLQGIIYSKILTHYVKLITICKNQADYLSKLYMIPLRKFDTIYNGVDTNRFTFPCKDFDSKQFREELQIPEDAFVILQIAAFRKEKKHEDSIKALKLIHNNYNLKPYLLFIGGGNPDIENRIKKFTEKYKLADYVRFCGKHEDVRPFYWISNIFTLSSVSVETFSIAALEAMACGLPCVLTDIGGANEMILNGTNGYLVPPNEPSTLADTWIRVLKN